METSERRYPVGIQTFQRIREGGYVYVDKTDLMWQSQKLSPYIFLSRPRRFGKSQLTTTFKSFFEGRRDLFEGLKVMALEREWEAYPVIHLDLSTAKSQLSADALRLQLTSMLAPYVEKWCLGVEEPSPGALFRRLIRSVYEQSGKQVVVLIDEYDAPLLDVLHDEQRLPDYRIVMQEFFQTLKASEAMIRFCFLTGITKFSQLSIFSTLNNLNNISMLPQFSAICGITETELATTLAPDIALLAAHEGCSPEEMHARLKYRYDGYHFSKQSEEIYNPYSLFKAFANQEVSNYWFDTGTPSYLIRQMQHFRTDITTMDNIEASSIGFDVPTEAMHTALPLLYQSGYLTIKDYDREVDMYTLSIPNQEVRVGFSQGLMPTYLGLLPSDVQDGFAVRFWRALKKGDLDGALTQMQAYFESLPYIEGFKRKLDSAAKVEGFYEWTFYLIFSMLNVYVRTQVKTIRGRADVVVQAPDAVYVMELKINGTAQEALDQVNSRRYAVPYSADGRRVVKVGIRFSTETLAVEDWVIEE